MDLISELNKKLGPTPRKFSFLDNLLYLRVAKPSWVKDFDEDEEKLHKLFNNYKEVFTNGVIVWGKVIQANEDIFKPGESNHPGELVYSFDEALNKNPRYLIHVADQLFALNDTKPDNRKLKEIADYLTDGTVRVFGLLVPKSISSQYTCRISTTFFVRKHLHESRLINGLMPIFVSPGKPYIALPVPCKYWEQHDINDQEDRWVTYPVNVEGEHTWISTNVSYIDAYKSDDLNVCCVVKVKYAESGMPSTEDVELLHKLDNLLSSKLEKLGAIYIGRVTANGHRSFAFQMMDCPEELVLLVTEIAYSCGLEFEIIHREKDNKSYYLEFLYPQRNDWRVIGDMQVLDALHEANDDPSVKREVTHFCYFKTKEESHSFRQWLLDKGYKLDSIEVDEDGEYLVKFSHEGSMHLDDISSHSIEIDSQCALVKGNYDGWETSVEEKQEVKGFDE